MDKELAAHNLASIFTKTMIDGAYFSIKDGNKEFKKHLPELSDKAVTTYTEFYDLFLKKL